MMIEYLYTILTGWTMTWFSGSDYHAGWTYVGMLHSLGWNQKFVVFLWLALEERSTWDYTRIRTHRYEVECEHQYQRNVEDYHQCGCWVPILPWDEYWERYQEDKGARYYTAHAVPLFCWATYAAVAEETDWWRPGLEYFWHFFGFKITFYIHWLMLQGNISCIFDKNQEKLK